MQFDLETKTSASAHDFFDKFYYIQLQTTDESLISEISQVIPFEDRFYILDKKSQSVFCFNAKGEFIFKIAKTGNGPEEYPYLESFNIDPANRQLMLLVPFGSLILYDLDGKFVSSIQLPKGAYDGVYPLNKDTLVLRCAFDEQIRFYSKSANEFVIKSFPVEKVYFGNSTLIYHYNDSLYFSPKFSDEVLNLTSPNQKLTFLWDFSHPSRKSKLKDAFQYMESNKLRDETLFYVIDNYLSYCTSYVHETKRFRIARLFTKYSKSRYLTVLYDKVTKAKYIFEETDEQITLCTGNLIGNLQIIPSSNIPENELRWPLSNYYNLLPPSDVAILAKHDPERDNPYLLIYKFKE